MAQNPLSPRHLAEAARLFSILADQSRLAILKCLMDGEKSVGQLATATNLSQANVSKHLAVLLSGHFVQRRKQGNFVFYQISDSHVYQLCQLMCGKIESDAKLLQPPSSTP